MRVPSGLGNVGESVTLFMPHGDDDDDDEDDDD